MRLEAKHIPWICALLAILVAKAFSQNAEFPILLPTPSYAARCVLPQGCNTIDLLRDEKGFLFCRNVCTGVKTLAIRTLPKCYEQFCTLVGPNLSAPIAAAPFPSLPVLIALQN